MTSPLLRTLATGPGSDLPPAERRSRRRAVRSRRQEAAGAPDRPTTVVVRRRTGARPWTLRDNRRWARSLARVMGPSLDRRLAAGHPPESDRLLAARAELLVSPARRLALAHQWSDLLAQARTPPAPRDPRAPVDRPAVVSQASEIRALLDVLASPVPLHVSGVALMSWLLSDGAGPVYHRQGAAGLAEALAEVSTRFRSSALFGATPTPGQARSTTA